MIQAIDTTAISTSASPLGQAGTGDGQGTGQSFDAALKAAQKAAQAKDERENELKSIREKGFTNWVRDARIEKLKEELRRTVMAEMGVTAESMNRLDDAARKALEQKIEEEVEKRLAELQEREAKGPHARQNQPGKNDQGGISCPVIPALAWPGGASIL
ncbi:MAG: hypothetical protein ACM33T_14055 [Solirubrobacterales bacterium]